MDNGATIVLVYNALGQQVGVTKGGTDVAWHLKSPADKSQGDYSIAYVGWNPAGVFFLGEKRVGFDVNGGIVFLHQNNLNSVTLPTTFDGSPFDDILYYPWGQYWEGEGFVFAGMDHYWEDVLHNTPNRQYAFYEGRWLSPDSLAGDVTNPQSWNRYAYVLNNPTSLTDPLGLDGNGCGPNDVACQSNAWYTEMEKYAFMTELDLGGLNLRWEFGLMNVPAYSAGATWNGEYWQNRGGWVGWGSDYFDPTQNNGLAILPVTPRAGDLRALIPPSLECNPGFIAAANAAWRMAGAGNSAQEAAFEMRGGWTAPWFGPTIYTNEAKGLTFPIQGNTFAVFHTHRVRVKMWCSTPRGLTITSIVNPPISLCQTMWARREGCSSRLRNHRGT